MTDDLAGRLACLHERIADDVPQIKRGQVWCHKCGATQNVNGANCLRHGWPLHCGETMSVDSPEERRARKLQGEAAKGGRMMPLTQVEAARVMDKHEKVLDAVAAFYRAPFGSRREEKACDRLIAAKRAFAQFVATLTDSEGL